MLRRFDIRARRAVRNLHLAWATFVLRAGAWADCRENQDRAVYACCIAAVGVVTAWGLK
jgi:hypothetical protein